MDRNFITYPKEKDALYRLLKVRLQGMADSTPDLIANLANMSALLNQAMTDINWVGFYLMKNGRLILGPFQGKPACVEIPAGQGVCGAAVARDAVMLVENVHEFPGHIAYDSASQSEIVIPMHKDGEIFGVLDIDSPIIARFDEEDRRGLYELVLIFERWLETERDE